MAAICAVAITGWVARPSLQAETSSPGPAALVADPTAGEWLPHEDPTMAYSSTGPLEPDPALAPEDVPVYYADGCQIAQGDPRPDPGCVYGDPGSSTEVVLWGDSKLGQYFSAFDAIGRTEGWRLTTYLKSACAPTVAGDEEDCNAFGRTVVDALLARPPHLVAISSGARTDPALARGMVEAARELTAAGIPVVVVMDNPHPQQTAFECAAENIDDLRACDFTPSPAAGELLRQVAADADLPVIDLTPWFCGGPSTCPVAVGGQLVYRQGSHITDTYARSLTPFLHRELSARGYADTPVEQISLDDVPARTGA